MIENKSRYATSHERLASDEQVRGSSDRAFGIVFTVVFSIVAFWPLLSGNTPHWWVLVLALGFGIVAFVKATLLAPLNRLWFRFGLLLNRIVSPLVMGLLFYLIITPFGLFMRLTGKDLLHLKYDSEVQSYWILRVPPGPSPETIKNQY